MAVKVGSARIDERGKITGGKAGDQTKNEVGTQNYYVHSKGWRVLRPIDPEAGIKMAKCMEMACANNHIGYDQAQRNDLYNKAKPYNFDVSKVNVDTETDCSALVRVCCAYAGIMADNFNTSSQASTLLKTGKFVELKDTKYTKSSTYLRKGDVLVTKVKGHTVIVLDDGPKAEKTVVPEKYNLGDRILKNGMEGEDVKELQGMLIQLKYNLGKWGADGEFGDATEMAVRSFQKYSGLKVDGQVGEKTLAMLESYFEDRVVKDPQKVRIVNGNCYVREEPNKESRRLGIAREDGLYNYLGETSEDGWNKIKFVDDEGWVSGRYSKLV